MKPTAETDYRRFLVADFQVKTAVVRVNVPSLGLFSVVCNFPGKKKFNLGWTPLHLASYFGHRDVVEELLKVGLRSFTNEGWTTGHPSWHVCVRALQAGADVNLSNNIGDTSLHKAAFTGRKVLERISSPLTALLISFSDCVFILFSAAHIHSSVPYVNQSNQSMKYGSGGCHAAAALWCMCNCHQWDSTDSQRCHSKPWDQKHARRWEMLTIP